MTIFFCFEILFQRMEFGQLLLPILFMELHFQTERDFDFMKQTSKLQSREIHYFIVCQANRVAKGASESSL